MLPTPNLGGADAVFFRIPRPDPAEIRKNRIFTPKRPRNDPKSLPGPHMTPYPLPDHRPAEIRKKSGKSTCTSFPWTLHPQSSYAHNFSFERSDKLTAGQRPAPPAGASWRSQLVLYLIKRVSVSYALREHHAFQGGPRSGSCKRKSCGLLGACALGGWRAPQARRAPAGRRGAL